MKSIKYDKEEFQDLVNSVTPLQAVEWLLMNGYPIQVRNLGKSTVDILCPSPDHNDTNFGNCKISTNRYDGRAGSRCHCYCCNMSYDSYDILKQFLSYRQSIEALIEISGKVDYYQSSKKIKKKKDPVAKETKDEPESDSGAMPESLDVQDRQEELLIGSVGEDHSDSDSFSTADAKNDTFEPTTDDATLERGESQAESPTIGSENANSFHEEYKAQFSDCLNAANALDDVLSQAIEDVFSDENLGYMDIVNAAADAITDHYNSDTPYSEAAESSADLVYEVTDLDGKPMDNMDTMAEKLQQNGLSAEHVDHLYELASDRYASPEEPFEQPDPYEGFMDLDSGVTDSVDRVDMSQSSSVDAQQKLDFYEPNQFLDQMSNDLDSYVQAIEHAENIGTDVPDTALSDIVGSSFSVDSLKSAIDLMEAEVKSTADDDRDAQETMDTDPVLSEDIPESSIEPEVDDSLDADEWRRYL